jgi:zinc transport system permease protein
MELLSYTFIQYAFIGGAAIAVLAGVLGPLVVQSRQAIASDMFAHVSLAGIGAALLVGVAPWWGALPALLLVSTAVWWLRWYRPTYSPDAIAMFFLSGGLALALALVHVARDHVFAFENYLFGSILTLSSVDVLAMVVATGFVVGLLLKLWYPLLGAMQSPPYQLPYRTTPQLVQLIFFWLLAIAVWIGIKTIGGLLIGALLVIPVLTVRSWVRSFAAVTAGSVVVALVAVWGGLLASLWLDVPPSSLIIGAAIILFGLQLGVQRWQH